LTLPYPARTFRMCQITHAAKFVGSGWDSRSGRSGCAGSARRLAAATVP